MRPVESLVEDHLNYLKKKREENVQKKKEAEKKLLPDAHSFNRSEEAEEKKSETNIPQRPQREIKRTQHFWSE